MRVLGTDHFRILGIAWTTQAVPHRIPHFGKVHSVEFYVSMHQFSN
jgi:hypothetical protein